VIEKIKIGLKLQEEAMSEKSFIIFR